MYKLILYLFIILFCTMLLSLQMDEELALQTLFQAKHAVNRAVHAAAQQTDKQKLSAGVISIDGQEAHDTAMLYLQSNLSLDGANRPLPGTFLRDPVEVLVFQVINDTYSFPYTYENVQYPYKVTLKRPGVILIIRLTYPRVFRMLGDIAWDIKGAAELYEAF